MRRAVGAVALLPIVIAAPVQDAAAQDPVGGAILGGVTGGVIGGRGMESVIVVARAVALSALVIGGLKIGPAVSAELQPPSPQNPPSYYSEEPVELGPPVVYAPPPPPVYYAYRVAPIVPGPYYVRRPYGLAYGRSYVWAHGPGGPRFGGYGPRGGRHLRW
jgi:hypothetical protein